VYIRHEHHRFADNVHYVKNTAFLEKENPKEVSLETVPRWRGLLAEGSIEAPVPLIVTYRTPYANNISLGSELPISFFANSTGTLRDIDEAHTSYRGEMKKAEAKIFADKTLISDNGELSDDLYVSFECDATVGIDNQMKIFSPTVREAQYKEALNTEFRLYEIQTGLSAGTLNFDSKKGAVTATQVISEDKTTYNTVKQIQKQLNTVLIHLTEAIHCLASGYGIHTKRTVPIIEFGDSVFEDTGTEFARRMQLVQAGVLKPELLLEWYFSVSEAEAKNMLPQMTSLFGFE
jgi:A118 family predicted phage portal protein